VTKDSYFLNFPVHAVFLLNLQDIIKSYQKDVYPAIIKWGCHAYNLLILSWINGSSNIEFYSINKIWELQFPYWSPSYSGKDYLPSLTLLCGINYSTWKQIGGINILLITCDNEVHFLLEGCDFFMKTKFWIFELVAMETGICYKYFATFSIIPYDTLKKRIKLVGFWDCISWSPPFARKMRKINVRYYPKYPSGTWHPILAP
jgi:hypothetical protein